MDRRLERYIPIRQFSADAYYNIVNDKIIAVPTMFVWKMSNIGKVETIGTDLTLAAELCPWDRWSIFGFRKL